METTTDDAWQRVTNIIASRSAIGGNVNPLTHATGHRDRVRIIAAPGGERCPRIAQLRASDPDQVDAVVVDGGAQSPDELSILCYEGALVAAHFPSLSGLATRTPRELIERASLWPNPSEVAELALETAHHQDGQAVRRLVVLAIAFDVLQRDGAGWYGCADRRRVSQGLEATVKAVCADAALQRTLETALENVFSALGADQVIETAERFMQDESQVPARHIDWVRPIVEAELLELRTRQLRSPSRNGAARRGKVAAVENS